jgi:hypothetical protein
VSQTTFIVDAYVLLTRIYFLFIHNSIAATFSKDLLIDPTSRSVSDIRHSITAVASSTSKERAEEFIKDVKADKQSDGTVAKAYGNYSDFVKDDNIDIVYVATPHSHHYENVLECLEAGRHVCCEVSSIFIRVFVRSTHLSYTIYSEIIHSQ